MGRECPRCEDTGWLWNFDEKREVQCPYCPRCRHGYAGECEFCETAPGQPRYQNTRRFTGDERPDYGDDEEEAA